MREHPARVVVGVKSAFATVTLLAGIAGLTACAESAPSSDPTPSVTGHRSATAHRGSITPVQTFQATVVSPAPFTVTAAANGTASIAANGEISVDGHRIELPAGAHVDEPLIRPGDTVRTGQPVASATYSGFVMQATVTPKMLLSFTASPTGAKGQIDGGGAPFECALLDKTPTRSDDGAHLFCTVPTDSPALAGMTGLMAVTFPTAQNVIEIPVDAVAGTVQNGAVAVIGADGKTQNRTVKLGVSDGQNVEIVSGLAEGERVRIPGPNIAANTNSGS